MFEQESGFIDVDFDLNPEEDALIYEREMEKENTNGDNMSDRDVDTGRLSCMKNYKKAAEILEKRQNKSEHWPKFLNLLFDSHQPK
ncbi:CLUMA_CG001498, isoform A [Clunio marinus]|uniref:CLUMA_CG001498, isoform A n=1 Tax=Clunio marinus TaxID=568069 RepID=A0A1J1HJX0_9DIPT|nr:CLUMA_CG001498, isoform A [Clunio marinus]